MPRAKAKKATPSRHQRLFLLIAVAFFALAGWEYTGYQRTYQQHVQQLEHKLSQAQNSASKPAAHTIKPTNQLTKPIKPSNLQTVNSINNRDWQQFLLTIQPRLVWTALWLSIGLIASIMFLSHNRMSAKHQSQLLATLITGFSITLIALLLYFTIQESRSHVDRTLALQGPGPLQKFLQQHHEQLKNMQLIPTGLEIKSLTKHHKPSTYEVDAVVWQQYPLAFKPPKELPIFFPNSTRLTQSKPLYHFQQDGHTMAAWEAIFQIQHHTELSHYPFDTKIIHIDMLAGRLNQTTQLIPHFDSYSSYAASSLPGISHTVRKNNKLIHDAYFDLRNNHAASTMGVKYLRSNKPYVLNYNIIIERNINKALFAYFIPLFVIIVTCYIMSTLINRKLQESVDNKLAMGAGLLFVIALTQIRFHQNFNSSMVSYYDALLVYMYLLVLVTTTACVFHAKNITLPWIESKITETSRFQSIFWPMNAVILLLITLVFFI